MPHDPVTVIIFPYSERSDFLSVERCPLVSSTAIWQHEINTNKIICLKRKSSTAFDGSITTFLLLKLPFGRSIPKRLFSVQNSLEYGQHWQIKHHQWSTIYQQLIRPQVTELAETSDNSSIHLFIHHSLHSLIENTTWRWKSTW